MMKKTISVAMAIAVLAVPYSMLSVSAEETTTEPVSTTVMTDASEEVLEMMSTMASISTEKTESAETSTETLFTTEFVSSEEIYSSEMATEENSLTVSVVPVEAIAAASAEDGANMQVSTVTANAGEDVDVVIELNNNPGIIAMGFTISYDTEALELVSAEDCNLFADASFTPGGDVTAVPYRLIWNDGLTRDNYTENGAMAILHFHVLDTAVSGLSEIEINVEDDNTFDVDLNDVHFDSVNGGVEIAGGEAVETTTTEKTTTAETTMIEETTETKTTTVEETTETQTTKTEETTETETTTINASVEDIRNWAMSDYEQKTGVTPAKSVASEENGTVTVILSDKDGNVLDTYTIDKATGTGTNKKGETINLPQTGITSPMTAMLATGAATMTAVGLAFLSIFRKRRDD